MNIKALPIALGVIIIILLGVIIFVPDWDASEEEQQNATSTPPVATSTPPVATSTPALYSYTSTKGKTVLVNVAPNQLLASPLRLEGQVATWYFEASFPVQLLDSTGKVIAQGPATAEGDWMVTTPVPYKLTLTFGTPTTATGTLVLHNDNASGLPENDDEVRIPVRFR